MKLHEKLKELRYRSKLSATFVSGQLGIAKSTLSNYESGTRTPNAEMLGKFAQFYNTSIDDLLDIKKPVLLHPQIQPVTNQISLPIFGLISSADLGGLEDNIIGYTDLGSEYTGQGEFFALYVTGDSMNNTRICDGDIVIVRKQSSILNGEIAVVLVEGENASVKKVFCTESTVTLIPSSTNPVHKPRILEKRTTSVAILGKVVEVKIKL